MIYLDNLATTPCDPAVMAAMEPWFVQYFGNASSLHDAGRQADQAVEHARKQCAEALGVQSREVVFTSGATESNNLAIKGAVRFLRAHGDARRHVVTVATEHKCVLESVRSLKKEGYDPIILPVGRDGRLASDILREALKKRPLLVSIMAANNETGVMHDLVTLAPLVKESGALLHVDMAQAVGKIPIDMTYVDLASVSAHKIYGPKGVGALYVRHRPRVRLQPLFSGGGQERGWRSGTAPVPLVVGMGEALQKAVHNRESEAERIRRLRDRLVESVRVRHPSVRINGDQAPRLPGVVNMCLPPGNMADDVMASMPHIACSTGSACSAASGAPSYVLESMGLSSAEARRSLRLSVGRFTSEGEIDCAVAQLNAVLDEKSTGRP